jgi:hypothetical protein
MRPDTVGMPSFPVPPLAFGISTCLTGGGSQGFHLYAGRTNGSSYGRDAHASGYDLRLHIDMSERQGMAHGDQVGGALGCLDSGEAGCLQRVALGVGVQRGDDLRGKLDEGRGAGAAADGLLVAHIDHDGLAGCGDVREAGL